MPKKQNKSIDTLIKITFSNVLPKLASSSSMISFIFFSLCLSSGKVSPITWTTVFTSLCNHIYYLVIKNLKQTHMMGD